MQKPRHWRILTGRRIIHEIQQIVAGGEKRALAGKDHHARGAVIGGVFQRIGDRRIHGAGEGIALGRAREMDAQNRAIVSNCDIGIGVCWWHRRCSCYEKFGRLFGKFLGWVMIFANCAQAFPIRQVVAL